MLLKICSTVVASLLFMAEIHGAAISSSPYMPPSNAIGGQTLVFRTEDNGRPWPITNVLDPGLLIPHSIHCLAVLEKFSREETTIADDVDRFHMTHCKVLGVRMLAFFQANPDYKVPKIICNDLRYLYGQMASLNGPRYEFHGRRHLLSMTTEPEGVSRLLFQQLANHTGNQDELFGHLCGQNLGDVMLKESRNLPMTPQETETIRHWNSDEVVRLGAMGVYCLLGSTPGQESIQMLRQQMARYS